MNNTRFHNSPEQYFAAAKKSILKGLESGRLTDDDATLIRDYVDEKSSRLSPSRYYKTVSTLVTVRKYFAVEFRKAKKNDYYAAMNKMRYANKPDGTSYKKNTIADYTKFTKRFFTWLAEENHVEIKPDHIQKFATEKFDRKTKSNEDVLSAEEITAIIGKAKSAKYKALLGILYEGGFRISEVASLRWRDITPVDFGFKIQTDGKTGYDRNLPIRTYQNYLAQWRVAYPGDPTGDAFVFITPSGKPLQYRGVAKAIKGFVKEAGITKNVTLHSFRHSRITHALSGGMQETVAKKAFWGNESTDMIASYSHLVDDDVDNAMAALSGVDIGKKKVKEAPRPVQCPECHYINPPSTRFCGDCGQPLTVEAIRDVESAQKKLLKIMQEKPSFALQVLEKTKHEKTE